MNHLLIFTISPVQSYIAQARKTKDLFAGSQLLSELTQSALESLPDNSEIIYPTLRQAQGDIPEVKAQGDIPESGKENSTDAILSSSKYDINTGLPNRIVAIINSDPENICKQVKVAVEDKFKEIANHVFVEINKKINDEQINSFLSINYVAVPIEKDYQTAYTTAERYLGAVKHAGQFQQIGEPAGRKCSLCGERNVLFYKKTEKGHIPKYTIDDALEITDNSLVPGEGLCVVCAAKRFYVPHFGKLSTGSARDDKQEAAQGDIKGTGRDDKKKCHAEQGRSMDHGNDDNKKTYPSTAYIALLNQIGKEKLDKWEQETGCDAQLMYDENLTVKNVEDCTGGKKITDIKKLRDDILNEKELKPSVLNKYYALIMFDGDNMGKWLSGKYLIEGKELKDFHEELSGKLSTFAKEAKNIVDKAGQTIYAGGDDFMGLVCPSSLFTVMNDLEKEFNEKVNTDELKNSVKEDKSMTFSTGIVIAHYKSPLSEVLKEARKQIKKAKQHDAKKHCIALSCITKSNNIYSTVFKQANTELLKDVIKLLQDNEKKVSSKFIFNFAREFRQFEDVYKIDEYETFSSMMMTELRRLYQRSSSSSYNEEFLVKLQRYFYSIVQDAGKGYTKIALTDFISFLEMADKLAREIDNV